jgi:AraC-like DNA-binding protein
LNAAGPTSYTRHQDLGRIDAAHLLERLYGGGVTIDADPARAFRMTVTALRLGPVTINQLSVEAAATVTYSGLPGYLVCAPQTGNIDGTQDGAAVAAWAGIRALAFRPGTTIVINSPAGARRINVWIEQRALEEELAVLVGGPVSSPVDLGPNICTATGPGAGWLNLVRMLRDDGREDTSLVHQPLMADRLWHSVVSGVLHAAPHRLRDRLLEEPKPVPPKQLRQVVTLIHAQPQRPYTVAQLAAVGQMSVRALQDGFRRHFAQSPMAYLLGVRLAEAHEALLQADPQETTVAAVANEWGFSHLGRFAQTYRERYGIFPSETLRLEY